MKQRDAKKNDRMKEEGVKGTKINIQTNIEKKTGSPSFPSAC